jgi:hypothetical protein
MAGCNWAYKKELRSSRFSGTTLLESLNSMLLIPVGRRQQWRAQYSSFLKGTI